MNDWIEQAAKREEKTRADNEAQLAARLEEIERLRTVFPKWQNLLLQGLRKICVTLAENFPSDPTRHYSVNLKPGGGYHLLCQGIPQKNLDLMFDLATQTMTVQQSTKRDVHAQMAPSAPREGKIKITKDSKAFIAYAPALADETLVLYSDPELLANDLMRELTGL